MKTISFVLNDTIITEEVNPALPLLDYIRKEKHLTGTKEVCKEGDCGACTALLGTLTDNKLVYKTITSCIYPIANCNTKHIVTIEGINKKELLLHQQMFLDENASQCGFCTPGFIMSLTCYLLNNHNYNFDEAKNAIAGNICRCTGYHSIERALRNTLKGMQVDDQNDIVNYLIEKNILPEYFGSIAEKLHKIETAKNIYDDITKTFIGGGSDLFVQRADSLLEEDAEYLTNYDLSYIYEEKGKITVGSATTFEEIKQSKILKEYFPDLTHAMDLIASLPVRNAATVGGNLTNASPIGDITIFLLSLNATIILSDGYKEKELPLSEYYLDYKKINKKKSEFIKEIAFNIPAESFKFSFEKVSKRTHLDIASVNSCILLEVSNNNITAANISAGGIAPIPKLLKNTGLFLIGKKITVETLNEAVEVAQSEISPISDARGSEAYKRLLLTQLIKAHFLKLFPEIITESELI